MTTHFTTVPVEIAVQAARVNREPSQALVLIVDDEALIVETLVSIMNGHGLATMPAMDAATALEMARLAPPDVLITDVKMPGLDGFNLALEVSKVAPDCDLILVSGEPSACHQAAKYRAQGLDFVLMIKPVHPSDLLACVYELLAMRGWLVPEIPPRRANPSDLLLVGPISPKEKKAPSIHKMDPVLQPPADALPGVLAPEALG